MRHALQREVHGRVDVVAAELPVCQTLFFGRAERLEVLDILDDEVAELLGVAVGRDAAVVRGRECDELFVDRGVDRLGVLGLGDKALGQHGVENDVAARLVVLVVVRAAERTGTRLLHDGDQACCLGNRDVARRNPEVLLRRRLNAVGVAAKASDVEVRQQNLVFGVLLLEADRELRLFELALEALLLRLCDERIALFLRLGLEGLGDEDVLDELHRECRGTRLDAARGQVAETGADDRLHVDAAVLVEPAVFTRDRGVFDVLRDRIPLDLFAVLREDGRDLAVPVFRVVVHRGVEHIALRLLVDLDVLRQAFEDSDGVARRHSGDGKGRGNHDGHENAGECAEAEHAGDRADDS